MARAHPMPATMRARLSLIPATARRERLSLITAPPLCERGSFSFACRRWKHRVAIRNISRRGGVEIFIGPPHKWATPSRPCATRTQNLPEIPKQSLALPAILTARPNLPIIREDSPKSGAICLRHRTNSVGLWLRRPMTPNSLRKRAFRSRLPRNTMRRTRALSWPML